MDNRANDTPNHTKKLQWHFEWLLPVLFKPGKAVHKITEEGKSVWLTPLLVVSALIILSVLVAAPIKRNVIQMGQNLPENFQYYSTEQQATFMSAQANQTSPLFLFILPMLGKLAGLWIAWFLLSSLLHLSLTLSGSRAASVRSYNLAGWSCLPLALRHLVQIAAMLISKTLITSPGLSGFVSGDVQGFAAFAAAFLGLIDLFFIWQILLVLIGSIPLSGLSKTKAWSASAISLLVLMLLQALPGFLSKVLSGFSTGSYYF